MPLSAKAVETDHTERKILEMFHQHENDHLFPINFSSFMTAPSWYSYYANSVLKTSCFLLTITLSSSNRLINISVTDAHYRRFGGAVLRVTESFPDTSLDAVIPSPFFWRTKDHKS